jgi:hypothetical protein
LISVYPVAACAQLLWHCVALKRSGVSIAEEGDLKRSSLCSRREA